MIIITVMVKLTVQRQTILDLINSSNKHWNADEVARALNNAGHPIGIATVYRALASLESQGLLDSIQMAEKKFMKERIKLIMIIWFVARVGRSKNFHTKLLKNYSKLQHLKKALC